MLDFHQKRKLRAVINSIYTQGFIMLMVLWVGWSAYVRYDIATEMKDRKEVAAGQLAALEARKEALAAQVEYLSNERGIEAEMRRQFDVALEGEQVIIITDPQTIEEEVFPLSTTTEPTRRWYQFWR